MSNYFGYDEELPNGFQDADFEMRELEELGNRIARLERKGICQHGAVVGYKYPAVYYEQEHMAPGEMLCHGCGAIFQGDDAWDSARYEARGGY